MHQQQYRAQSLTPEVRNVQAGPQEIVSESATY
jgi:hypothetical protein